MRVLASTKHLNFNFFLTFILLVNSVSVESAREWVCDYKWKNINPNCKVKEIISDTFCYLNIESNKNGVMFATSKSHKWATIKFSGMKKHNYPFRETNIFMEYIPNNWQKFSWKAKRRNDYIRLYALFLNNRKVVTKQKTSWKYIRIYVKGSMFLSRNNCVHQRDSKKILTTPSHTQKDTFLNHNKPTSNNSRIENNTFDKNLQLTIQKIHNKYNNHGDIQSSTQGEFVTPLTKRQYPLHRPNSPTSQAPPHRQDSPTSQAPPQRQDSSTRQGPPRKQDSPQKQNLTQEKNLSLKELNGSFASLKLREIPNSCSYKYLDFFFNILVIAAAVGQHFNELF